VKLGPSYFIPNLQIGSFGAITPFAGLLKNRSQLWDVAAAGPIAGLSFAAALLFIGLDQSHPGALPKVGLGLGGAREGIGGPQRAQEGLGRIHVGLGWTQGGLGGTREGLGGARQGRGG
jgi:hypothetical protein